MNRIRGFNQMVGFGMFSLLVVVICIVAANMLPGPTMLADGAGGKKGADSAANLKDINVDVMLRGYCYAGSHVTDRKALGGFAESDNMPRRISSDMTVKSGSLYLTILPDTVVAIDKEYRGMRLRLINATDDTVAFDASDSRLDIVQEVLMDGWRPVEYLPSSWCGNSYHKVFLKPDEYWSFDAPRYKGRFPARFRFVLTMHDREEKRDIRLYSEEFEGSVNPRQCKVKQGHTPRDIMDPYND